MVMGMAEHDLPKMQVQVQVQVGALFSQLITQHGFQPGWRVTLA